MKKISPLLLLLLILFSSCKKADNPVTAEESPVTGKISGTVTESLTGIPVSQVYITSSNSTGAVTTELDGTYSLFNIKPGTYKLTAAKQGYDTSSVSITVEAGYTTKADFIITKTKIKNPGIITGRVLNASDDSGIFSANIVTDPYVSSINTDSKGNFDIRSVPSGSYQITASKFGFVSKTLTISVESDSVSTVEFVLEPSYATIKGKITDAATNLPVEGVNVKTSPATGSVTTDASGNYVISDVPKLAASGAKYTLTATKVGFDTGTVDVAVIPGKITTADMILKKTN